MESPRKCEGFFFHTIFSLIPALADRASTLGVAPKYVHNPDPGYRHFTRTLQGPYSDKDRLRYV
jgi:hypothetical protein